MKKVITVLLALAGFLVIIGLSINRWWQQEDILPTAQIPSPTLPSPNAYDFYVKAGYALVSAPKDLDPIFDSQNLPELDWKAVYPLAKKEAWLKQNTTALRILRQGFDHPAQVPASRAPDNITPPHSRKFRSLARLLIVEGRVHGERGRWKEAAQSATDILKLAGDLSQGGALINHLTGQAIAQLGLRELERIRPHLNSNESAAIAREMEKLFHNRVVYAEVLRNEKHAGQSLLLEAMRSPNWRAIASSADRTFMQRWQILLTPRQTVFRNYSDYMDTLIALAQKPYATPATLPPPPQDFYNRSLAQAMRIGYWSYTKHETRYALSFLAMALQAYHLDFKTYPQTLKALTPRYLKTIPNDPFGAGKPLRYRQSGNKYLLYSISSDGKDDSGRDLENDREEVQRPGNLSEIINSKGDMAVGSHWTNQRW